MRPEASRRTPRRKFVPGDVLAGLALLVLSAGLRIAYVLGVADHPAVRLPMVDSRSYHVKALRILQGDWLGSEVFYQDPLYPYVLAGFYALFGPETVGVLVAQALFDALTVLLVFLIARRLFDLPTALLAGLLASTYKMFFFYDALLLKVWLTVLLIVTAFHLLLLAAERDRPAFWLAAGLALGTATLTRGNYLLFVPVVLAWAALVQPGERGARILRTLLVGVGVAAAILPVTVRNYAVGHDLVLVTSQAGQNFYIGNHRDNDSGRYRAPSFVRANPFFEERDFRAEAVRRTGTELSPSQVSRFWLRETLAEISSDPGHFARHTWRKAVLLANHYEVPASLSFYFFQVHVAPALALPAPSWGFLLPLALLGMLAARRDRRAWLLGLFLLTYAATIVVTFNMSRYRMPLAPVLIIFGAGGVGWIVRSARERHWRAVTIALAGLALGWWLVHRDVTSDDFAPAHFNLGSAHTVQAERQRAHAQAFERVGKLERARSAAGAAAEQERLAEAQFRLGLALAPRHARLRAALVALQLGRLETLLRTGPGPDALPLAREIVELDPDSPDAQVALARVLSRLGEYTEAERALERALVLAPGHPAAARERAFLAELRSADVPVSERPIEPPIEPPIDEHPVPGHPSYGLPEAEPPPSEWSGPGAR